MMTIQQFLDDHNIDYQTEGKYCREGWLQLHCIFCGGGTDPNKPYLGIPIQGNIANCWQCGRHNIYITLAKFTGKKVMEIIELIGKPSSREYVKTEHTGKFKPPEGIYPLINAHKQYLSERGFNWREIEKTWGIGGIGFYPVNLHWRLYIPIDYQGRMVSWTTRLIDDTYPGDRYISASPEHESIPHKELLYGEDYCRNSIVVVEGPLDAWAIGPGAVATFGTGVTDSQILKIIQYPRVCLCFDSEPEAQNQADELYRKIKPMVKSSVANIQLECGKDPADCLKTKKGRYELERVRRIFLEK